MSKKYVESRPSELGTLPRTNWNWFPATLNCDTWYTNGQVVMALPPVKVWPTEPPRGMTYRVKNFQNPPEIPISHAQLALANKLLRETGSTERKGRTMGGLGYQPGIVELMDADGIKHSVARHYHALVTKKFPRALPFGSTSKDPVIYREPDSTLVAILMPIRF